MFKCFVGSEPKCSAPCRFELKENKAPDLWSCDLQSADGEWKHMYAHTHRPPDSYKCCCSFFVVSSTLRMDRNFCRRGLLFQRFIIHLFWDCMCAFSSSVPSVNCVSSSCSKMSFSGFAYAVLVEFLGGRHHSESHYFFKHSFLCLFHSARVASAPLILSLEGN